MCNGLTVQYPAPDLINLTFCITDELFNHHDPGHLHLVNAHAIEENNAVYGALYI